MIPFRDPYPNHIHVYPFLQRSCSQVPGTCDFGDTGLPAPCRLSPDTYDQVALHARHPWHEGVVTCAVCCSYQGTWVQGRGLRWHSALPGRPTLASEITWPRGSRGHSSWPSSSCPLSSCCSQPGTGQCHSRQKPDPGEGVRASRKSTPPARVPDKQHKCEVL